MEIESIYILFKIRVLVVDSDSGSGAIMNCFFFSKLFTQLLLLKRNLLWEMSGAEHPRGLKQDHLRVRLRGEAWVFLPLVSLVSC